MRPSTFLRTFWRSISDVQYYRQLAQTPITFSLRFFVIAMLLLGVVVGSVATARDIAFWKQTIAEAQRELIARYPDDLVIRWTGSELQSSQSPLTIPFPSNSSRLAQQFGLPSSLAYFNGDATTGNQTALFTLSSSRVFVQTDPGQFQDIALAAVIPGEPEQITKTTIEQQTQRALNQITDISVFLFGLLSVAMYTLSLLLSGLIIAAVESAVLYLILVAIRKKMAYAKLWQLSLHVLVLAEVVEQVAGTLFPNVGMSWLSISYWVCMVYILLSLQAKAPKMSSQD